MLGLFYSLKKYLSPTLHFFVQNVKDIVHHTYLCARHDTILRSMEYLQMRHAYFHHKFTTLAFFLWQERNKETCRTPERHK